MNGLVVNPAFYRKECKLMRGIYLNLTLSKLVFITQINQLFFKEIFSVNTTPSNYFCANIMTTGMSFVAFLIPGLKSIDYQKAIVDILVRTRTGVADLPVLSQPG